MILCLFGYIDREHRDGLEIIYNTLHPPHPPFMLHAAQIDRQDPVGKLNCYIRINAWVMFPAIPYQDKLQIRISL